MKARSPSRGGGHTQEAQAPGTSLLPHSWWRGARVLRRLKHLQNTALFSEHRQTRLLSLQESRNTVRAQENSDLEL